MRGLALIREVVAVVRAARRQMSSSKQRVVSSCSTCNPNRERAHRPQTRPRYRAAKKTTERHQTSPVIPYQMPRPANILTMGLTSERWAISVCVVMPHASALVKHCSTAITNNIRRDMQYISRITFADTSTVVSCCLLNCAGTKPPHVAWVVVVGRGWHGADGGKLCWQVGNRKNS